MSIYTSSGISYFSHIVSGLKSPGFPRKSNPVGFIGFRASWVKPCSFKGPS